MINKRLFKETRVKFPYIPFSILHSLSNSIFIILNAYLLTLIVDAIFLKKRDLEHIKIYLLLFLLNAGIKALLNLLMDNFIKDCSEDIKENIKKNTFQLIISSNPYKVKRKESGEVITLLTEGCEMLTPYFSQYIPQFFSSVLIPLVICISVAFIDRLSALIMVITYPIIPLFMTLIGYKSKEINNKQWKKLDILSSHFLEMLQGLRTLKIFGRSKIQEEKVFQVSENYRKSTMDVLKVSFLSALVLETASTISTAVVAVNLGLRLVYSKIDFFTAFFILIVTPDFYLPLRQLGLKFHSSLKGKIAIEKIETLESTLGSNSNSSHLITAEESLFEIEVKDLSYCHDSREALNSISFKIKSTEKVALIGESGSGKSTLINILSGFLKAEDNRVFINGKDINHLDKYNYWGKLALVPQFPHIFNMNIEDNILLGNRDINYKTFINICKITKVHDFASEFKDKYKTVIGDGEAVAISGGEKQRIAMARALAKNAEFIIFDEPTSALDPVTEELMAELFNTYLRNNTVLVAAHRLNTIKNVDRVIVINNGNLIEMGTHQELMEKKGPYYNLVKTLEDEL